MTLTRQPLWSTGLAAGITSRCAGVNEFSQACAAVIPVNVVELYSDQLTYLMFLLINFLIEVVNFCRIVSCENRANRAKDRSFHRIPGIVKHQGPETEEKSKPRREKWLALTNREDLTEEKLPFVRVCSDHFKSGKLRPGTNTSQNFKLQLS